MRPILGMFAWALAGILAVGVLLTLYEPSLLVKLLRRLNLTVGIQDLVIWAAFLIGAIIVLVALIGSFKKGRPSDRVG